MAGWRALEGWRACAGWRPGVGRWRALRGWWLELPAWWRAAGGALPYPALLVAGTLALRGRPPGTRTRWLRYASTDLANLADHPVRCLAASAVLCEGDLIAWTVLALLGMAAVARRLGAWRCLLLVSGVHVLATYVSQGLVAYRIGTGALPASARVMSDVGPSYAVVAALVAAIGYGTRGGRVAGALGFAVLAPSLFTGLPDLDVAAVGHVTSIALALLLGWALSRTGRWWPSADSNRGP